MIDGIISEAETLRAQLGNLLTDNAKQLHALRVELEKLRPEVPATVNPAPHALPTTYASFDREVSQNFKEVFLRNMNGRLENPLSNAFDILLKKVKEEPGDPIAEKIVALRTGMDMQFDCLKLTYQASAFEAYSKSYDLLVEAIAPTPVGSENVLKRSIRLLSLASPGGNTSLSDYRDAVLHPSTYPANEIKQQETLDEWVPYLRAVVERLAKLIRLRVGKRATLLSALDRFRLRAERYDAARLRDLPGVSKWKQRNKRIENRLRDELARYLFDCGFDPITEVSLGAGRADLVEFSSTYVEAKQVGASGSAAKVRNARQN